MLFTCYKWCSYRNLIHSCNKNIHFFLPIPSSRKHRKTHIRNYLHSNLKTSFKTYQIRVTWNNLQQDENSNHMTSHLPMSVIHMHKLDNGQVNILLSQMQRHKSKISNWNQIKIYKNKMSSCFNNNVNHNCK
jgi:hypothetical protein